MNKIKSSLKGINVQGSLPADVPFSEEHPHLVAIVRIGMVGLLATVGNRLFAKRFLELQK